MTTTPPVLRQITSCTQPATRTTSRRNSQQMLYELHFCDRHRHLAATLAGSSYLNHRRTRPAQGAPQRCGTLHDYQPIDKAISSHTRLWLNTPNGSTWIEQLRSAAEIAAHVGARTSKTLTEILHLAEAGPDDPDTQRQVLILLAQAETEHTMR